MSSIAEKSSSTMPKSNNNKKGIFFRSDSLQKLKCSAIYPFQLAGTKFTKESFTQLFELLILKSRNILQKALLIISWPAFKVFGAAIFWWLNVSAKIIGINLIFDEKNIFNFKNHQNIGQSDFIINDKINISYRRSLFKKQCIECNKHIITSTTTTTTTELHTSQSSTKSISQFLSSSIGLSTDKENIINENQTLNLIIYYAGGIFVHLQVLLLITALSSSITSIGLIFLILSFAFICVIVLTILTHPPKTIYLSKKIEVNHTARLLLIKHQPRYHIQ